MLLAAMLVLASVDAPADPIDGDFAARLVAAAHERTEHTVTYDGRYFRLDYPGGDVPDTIGVCTDVVIRAYRAVGIDLQQAVHEDMREHFDAYPAIWGLTRPDPNIDHRRVPNLRVFLTRKGQSLTVTRSPVDYRPGDLVTWTLPGNLPHIGIVVDRRSQDEVRPLVVHNIGHGPRLEDVLFDFPITGHYSFPGTLRSESTDTRSAPTDPEDRASNARSR